MGGSEIFGSDTCGTVRVFNWEVARLSTDKNFSAGREIRH
jgi:hypothetical protein